MRPPRKAAGYLVVWKKNGIAANARKILSDLPKRPLIDGHRIVLWLIRSTVMEKRLDISSLLKIQSDITWMKENKDSEPFLFAERMHIVVTLNFLSVQKVRSIC